MNLLIEIPGNTVKGRGGPSVKKIINTDLVYVSAGGAGIRRKKHGNGFNYINVDGTLCKDKTILERIKKLAIPPAWKNVWICPNVNGHLQSVGYDTMGRKQYRYHTGWSKLRNGAKFFRLPEFGEVLPAIRAQVKHDIELPGLPQPKVIALVINIMEKTFIRIGNNSYEKLYGSYGLTTLKNKHIKFEGDIMRFCFKGKKGIFHEIKLKSRKLAHLVKRCRELKGHELFQYYDDTNQLHSVDSGMVNAYLKDITGKDFTAKDFRTWGGTIESIKSFIKLGKGESETDTKNKLNDTIRTVSKHLGNTVAICKKYYIHPVVIETFLTGHLFDYLEKESDRHNTDDLSIEERLLMKLLRNTSIKQVIEAVV